MNNDINITLIQFDIAWEQKGKNLAHLENILSNLKTHSDLIVLPEMFSTGFTMNTKDLAEKMKTRFDEIYSKSEDI